MATGFQYSSITVRDSIQKSKLISEGPSARYRLLTTRKNLYNDGSVRKWTFGEQDNNMQNKILLMVGEPGTGKTTLINAMVNYILGVTFTDEVWFEITEEGGDNLMPDQSQSQTTTTITVYEVFAQDNPICLTIIHTPGYGDTRGTEYGRHIADNLYKLFCNCGVKEIDAVCLVVKAFQNRLSDRQLYIFDAVLSLFSKDIENNIVIFITHSDGMPPDNALNAIKKAGILCRKDEDNEPEYFLFNNRQTEKRNKKYNRALQTAWELTEESLNDFFDSLKEQNRKSFGQTEEVLMESRRLEACITNLQNCIDFGECKGEELVQIQKALEENQEKIKKNEKHTFKGCNISETGAKFDTESFKNVRKNLQSNKEQKEEKLKIVKRLKEDIDKTEKEKADLIEEAYTTITKLCALKPDSAFIVQDLDFLIHRAEETGKHFFIIAHNLRELRKIQPESQERADAVMMYVRAGFTRLKKCCYW